MNPAPETPIIGKSYHIKIFHWFFILLSAFLTFAIWSFIEQQNVKALHARFELDASEIVERVRVRMQKYEVALLAGTATIRAHNDVVTLENWIDFSEILDIDTKYPGINGIGVIHSIEPENLASFIAAQRVQRPAFDVHPKHDKPVSLPITYIEPVAFNEEALGLDLAFEKNRYEAAIAARDTGLPKVTGPIQLVQDHSKTPGFLFYVPYYSDGSHPVTKFRREHFIGLVYAPFVVKRFMEGVVGESGQELEMQISDDGTVVYDTFSEDGANSEYIKKIRLEFYGRQWAFEIRGNKFGSGLDNSSYSYAILIFGGIITTLLFILFQAQAKINRRAIYFAKQMTAELEEKTIKLQRSNEDLEQFAYVASHDLQEPLRVIGNFTQLLQKRYHGQIDEKADLYIKHTVDGVTQMQRLLIDLLDYARVTASDSEKKQTDLNTVLQEVLADLEVMIEEANATVNVVRLPSVLGESTLLYQLFQNLISNAIKFRQDGRDIVVDIQLVEREKDWCISIADNGIGMEEQYIGKIFVMFQRLHNRSNYKGSGVGLAICKKVVLTHGGEIWVESTFGSGSTFNFTLPKL